MKKIYICPRIECMNIGKVLLYSASVDGLIDGAVGARKNLLYEDGEFYDENDF